MAKPLDPDKVQLATRIPKSLHRALKLEAITHEVTVEAWILDALETYMARVRTSDAPKATRAGT